MTRDLTDTVKALSAKAATMIVRSNNRDDWTYTIATVFEPAIRKLIAQETESCAAVCDSYIGDNLPVRPKPLLRELAKAIRARGGKS
jgi:hypothetical protein